MPSIAPCLWFDGQAEEAARFYTSIFPGSHIHKISRAATDVPNTRTGEVLIVDFTLDGQRMYGLNGGPDFTFSEAISMYVDCADQAEVDRYWEVLVEGGGTHDVCGWLKDRFGVSWQIVPRQLTEMMDSDDRAAAKRATEAMLKMTKIDVEQVRRAFEGGPV